MKRLVQCPRCDSWAINTPDEAYCTKCSAPIPLKEEEKP
jgi:DNA-directed RNA polymerase subunit RPC12/RpoP